MDSTRGANDAGLAGAPPAPVYDTHVNERQDTYNGRKDGSHTPCHHDNGEVTASAPGKVILFGEHFVVHGTAAILCAIDRRVYVKAARSHDIRIVSDLGTLVLESCSLDVSDADPVLRPLYHIVKTVLGMIPGTAPYRSDDKGGITLYVTSDIPSGAGLGSSSACCVAAAAAALGITKTGASIDRIIEIATAAERTVFPKASGADTAASALGGMITYDTRSGYRRINLRDGAGFGLVVSDSGIIHNTESIVGKVAVFRNENPSVFDDICKRESELVSRVLGMLEGSCHVVCDGPSLESTARELGRLASLNQEYLAAIGVSNEKLDEMARTMSRVTYGAKITGAGGGGCVVAFTDESDRDAAAHDAARRLACAGHDCFAAGIDNSGLNTF